MLRVLLKPLVATLQLFALYVVLHGHYSPGGGFQGGVLFACSLILPALVHGREQTSLTLSMRGALVMATVGVIIFAGIGILSMFFGGTIFDYNMLPVSNEMAMRRSLGILLIEIGVTFAVAGSVVAIFYILYADIPKETSRIEHIGEDLHD
jgi:multicomponent Na+:H+ antiporter subunit B